MSQLIPSFFTSLWKDKYLNNSKLAPTAYLNGVRGIAAFCVWCRHFTNDFYHGELYWGYHSRPSDVWISQLPFIRIIYGGGFMVCVFFILSGFVLAYKPLQYARSQNHAALLKSLSSSVFRRGLRLFLPCVPPLLLAAVFVHFRVYGVEQHPFDRVMLDSGHATLLGELGDAWRYLNRLLNFFETSDFSPTTIPALCK
jgi:peptidoglycan/LPS O-acetylase OafA/YrhL